MLLQRLSEAGEVAVAQDPEAPGEELRALAVALHLLRPEEPHERLGDGEAAHRLSGFGSMKSRITATRSW